MKGTKYAELTNMNDAELKKQIAETQSRLVALQFQKTIGQLDNHAQFTTLKRDIARMNTALTSRKPASN